MRRAEGASAEVVLTEEERDQLARWARGSASPRLAVRAQIVLRCAEPGAVYERIASDLGVTTMTVGSWRKRFAAGRVDGLRDGERPGRPKTGLVLTCAERDQLTRWARRAERPPAPAQRARRRRGVSRG